MQRKWLYYNGLVVFDHFNHEDETGRNLHHLNPIFLKNGQTNPGHHLFRWENLKSGNKLTDEQIEEHTKCMQLDILKNLPNSQKCKSCLLSNKNS